MITHCQTKDDEGGAARQVEKRRCVEEVEKEDVQRAGVTEEILSRFNDII